MAMMNAQKRRCKCYFVSLYPSRDDPIGVERARDSCECTNHSEAASHRYRLFFASTIRSARSTARTVGILLDFELTQLLTGAKAWALAV